MTIGLRKVFLRTLEDWAAWLEEALGGSDSSLLMATNLSLHLYRFSRVRSFIDCRDDLYVAPSHLSPDRCFAPGEAASGKVIHASGLLIDTSEIQRPAAGFVHRPPVRK